MSTEDPEEATMVTRLLNSIRTLTASLRPRRIRPIVPPVTVTDANDREVQIRQYSEVTAIHWSQCTTTSTQHNVHRAFRHVALKLFANGSLTPLTEYML